MRLGQSRGSPGAGEMKVGKGGFHLKSSRKVPDQGLPSRPPPGDTYNYLLGGGTTTTQASKRYNYLLGGGGGVGGGATTPQAVQLLARGGGTGDFRCPPPPLPACERARPSQGGCLPACRTYIHRARPHAHRTARHTRRRQAQFIGSLRPRRREPGSTILPRLPPEGVYQSTSLLCW